MVLQFMDQDIKANVAQLHQSLGLIFTKAKSNKFTLDLGSAM